MPQCNIENIISVGSMDNVFCTSEIRSKVAKILSIAAAVILRQTAKL
jgi:hypothetical protein